MNPYCFLYSNALERFSQNKTVGSCDRRSQQNFLKASGSDVLQTVLFTEFPARNDYLGASAALFGVDENVAVLGFVFAVRYYN